MFDALKTGPLPLLYPCHMPGMVEAAQRAARMTSASRTFDREAVGRLRGTGRQRHEWRIPAGSGVLYLEIWADDVVCRPHAIGVLFHRDSGDCAITIGKGWPGDDPEVLPCLLTISGGGQVEMKTPRAVKSAVERTACDLMADVLRALDAVARGEGGGRPAAVGSGSSVIPTLPSERNGKMGYLVIACVPRQDDSAEVLLPCKELRMPDIVSHACRSLFLDYLISESSLGEIQRAFEAANITYVDNGFGQVNSKRRLVQGYFSSIDWQLPVEVAKFFEVVSFYMTREETRGISFSKEHPVSRFVKSLKICGFEFRDGNVIALSHSARLADAKAMAATLDLPHLEEHIRRIETSIDADPALAIGSAKEMVETVCKTILTKRASSSGIIYSKEDDLNELGKKTFGVLRQLPDDIPDKAKGAKTIKTMLSNLRSVVQCTAELRNWYGNGHGREGDIKRGLSPRHARLVVGAASTLSWYLLETDRDMG